MASSPQKQIILLLLFSLGVQSIKKVHYVHWNRANPMFRSDNDDHILQVNKGNLPWEYDQVNIICPVSKPGSRYPESHVIYSVTKEEYESCRITNPKPKIVAICNRPYSLIYFTITFRSFTPTPGGLEFKPGQDYYFISTSSPEDLHRRVGGGCSTHKMKMIFKVADNRHQQFNLQQRQQSQHHSHLNVPRDTTTTTSTSTTTRRPRVMYNSRVSSKSGDYIYYYNPRDLIELEDNLRKKMDEVDQYENEVLERRRNEALKYTSSSSSSSSSGLFASSLVIVLMLLLNW